MKWIVAAVLIWAAWTWLKRPTGSRQPVRPIPRDEADARDVLGVSTDADAEEIRAAHRKLVASVHPDRGGSAELTRRVNAARDLLLRSQG